MRDNYLLIFVHFSIFLPQCHTWYLSSHNQQRSYMSSPHRNAFSSPFDLESISNGFHSLSITDLPKFEQFPQVPSPSSIHSPPPLTDLPKATTWKSKMPTSIQPFRGVQDNLKDPDEYIEDLEWAYTQDYQSVEPPHNPEARQTYINKTFRILFRNHLEGRVGRMVLELSTSDSKRLGYPQDFLPRAFQASFTKLTDQTLGEDSRISNLR